MKRVCIICHTDLTIPTPNGVEVMTLPEQAFGLPVEAVAQPTGWHVCFNCAGGNTPHYMDAKDLDNHLFRLPTGERTYRVEYSDDHGATSRILAREITEEQADAVVEAFQAEHDHGGDEMRYEGGDRTVVAGWDAHYRIEVRKNRPVKRW